MEARAVAADWPFFARSPSSKVLNAFTAFFDVASGSSALAIHCAA